MVSGLPQVFASSNSTFSVQILPLPQCSDGGDNDGDGAIDYPADTGCSSSSDESEADDTPTPTPIPTPTPTPTPGPGGGILPVVPITSVSFTGKAYPYALINLLKDGSLIGSIAADIRGDFQLYVSTIAPGDYVFSLYAQDALKNTSSLFVITLTLLKGSLTNVSNIFLSPTIDIDHDEVKRGDPLTVSGQSAPSARISISLVEAKKDFVTQSDSKGFYNYALPTTGLTTGEYTVQTRATLNGAQSGLSKRIRFAVGTKTIPKEPGKCFKVDLNCDGRVNLIDFSILIYYWQRPLTPSAQARVDFNNDTTVDLIDFSIMVYYWTG